MTETLTDAAERLAGILERENERLRRGDTLSVAAAMGEKQAASNAMTKLLTEIPSASKALDPTLTERVRALAAENQVLLGRALAVQERLIGIVASAGSRTAAAPRYGATGNLAVPRVTPFALRAQA